MDLFEQLDRSACEFRARLGLVRHDGWDRPTPCDEWDVRALVNHVVGGAVRYGMLLHGATAADLAPTRSADHLRSGALEAFDREARAVTAAFREQGALSRVVHHPAGDRSGEELLEMRITELAVHAWDLARAIGADEELDPALADEMWRRISAAGTRLEGGGYFRAPPGHLPDGASPQTKLLGLLGRGP